MIITRGLTRVYHLRRRRGLFSSRPTEITAVRDLDMEIRRGEIVGLLGLNGAGKTTTIKMLSTLLEPTRGTGEVDGLDLVRDARRIRAVINMVAGGERMLYWRLTARENLWYFAQLYGLDRAETRSRVGELLELVGLTDNADVPVERLSKGMKQRLQVVRGLINRPRYLFLDEPTLGLDVPVAREVRTTVKRLARERNTGVLLASHYMAEVEELCDRVYLIHKGELVASGTPLELKRLVRPWNVLKVVVSGEGPGLREELGRLCAENGARLEDRQVEAGCEFTFYAGGDLTADVVSVVTAGGGRVVRLDSVDTTLEDALVALTRG